MKWQITKKTETYLRAQYVDAVCELLKEAFERVLFEENMMPNTPKEREEEVLRLAMFTAQEACSF